MDDHKYAAEFSVGDEVEGFYLLKAVQQKVSAAGKPFLSAGIADRTGSAEIKVWDYAGPVSAADTGKVAKIRGQVISFKGALQVRVERIRLAEPSDRCDLTALVPVAPIDVDAALRDVRERLGSIEDADYRRVAETLFERNVEAFSDIPAAKSVHHAFLHGLLMHTSNMLKAADFLSRLYADVIDRSLLLAGTLLHDFKKPEEFVTSELGLVTEYSTKGELLGHLVMGAQAVADAAAELGVPEEKSVLLQHLILSHHGTPEFGAAVRPMSAEAELLSYIDLIDSRMEIYAEAFAGTPVGAFSERVFALDGRRVYHHA